MAPSDASLQMAAANNLLARNSKTTPCKVAYRTSIDGEKSPCRFLAWFPLMHKRWSDPCISRTGFGIAFGSSVEELADFLQRDEKTSSGSRDPTICDEGLRRS